MRMYKQSKPLSSNKRKVHFYELMLEKCPFLAGSDLVPKWHLVKQHSDPVSPHSTFFDTFDPSLASTEGEEDKLRERRRFSIEEGVNVLEMRKYIHLKPLPSFICYINWNQSWLLE